MTETLLTIAQISNLSGILSTGGTVARAATKSAAVKRFLAVAEANGITNATDILAMTFEVAKPTAEMVKAALDAAALQTANAALDRVEESLDRIDEKFAEHREGVTAEIVPFVPAEPVKSPGLARLRAAKNAEEIRTSTVAASDAATAAKPAGDEAKRDAKVAAIRAERESTDKVRKTKAEKPAKAPKVAKAKKEKAAKPAGSNVKIDLAAVITAVVPNPKQKGARSFACFEIYRVGQTVQGFIDACVAAGFPATEAKSNLSWDRRKGFITIA